MQPIAKKVTLIKKPKYVSRWALEHPVARFVKLTESVSAGLLLAQIVFWHLPGKTGRSKLRTPKKGYWWVAKSRAEWMYETGLTLEEYKSAIQLLISRNLVEVKQMPWDNLNLTHVRILDKSLLDSSGGKATTRLVGNHPLRVVEITPLCTTERITENTTVRTGEDASRAGEDETETGRQGGRERGEERGEEEDPGEWTCMVEPASTTMEENTMRAEDILKRPRTSPEKGALAAYWAHLVSDTFGGFQKPLTTQERGQLSLLVKGLGGQAREVLAHTIENWAVFAVRAEQAAGLNSSPDAPHIGFLLKHYDVAVDLLADKTKPEPVADETQVVSVTPLTPTPAEKEVPHVLTDEEFRAMMAELEK